MKKALSIVLSIVLVVTSFSVLFTLEAGALPTNYLTNGDLSNVANFSSTATSFSVTGFAGYVNGDTGATSITKSTASDFPANVKTGNTNVINFSMPHSAKASNMMMYSTNTYTLKENTNYEASVWIKTTNLYGMKFYIYEPTYTNRLNVANQTSAGPQEGQNIYSFTYDAGADTANPPYRLTRVARTDVSYTYKANGTATEGSGTANASMCYMRGTATQLEKDTGVAIVVGSDNYFEPSLKYGTSTNGWVKLTVSFRTKAGTWSYSGTGSGATNLPYSVPVALGIGTRDQAINATTPNTTLSVAGFGITEGYNVTGTVDTSYKGGTVSLNGGTASMTSVTGVSYAGDTTLTATPYAGNQFLGWYNNTAALSGTLLSTSTSYAFNPSADATVYARFQNNNIASHDGFEDYAANTTLASGGATSNAGDETSTDGWHTGISNWFYVKTVTTPVYAGARSLEIYHRYNDGVYYEFTVEANKDYYVSFKWLMPAINGTTVTASSLRNGKVTTTSGTNLGGFTGNPAGTGTWQDCTLNFNSGANTTLRLVVNGDTNSGTASENLHIDNLYIFKKIAFSATKNSYGGTVSVNKTSGIPGESVTFTATPNSGNTFQGWYKSGTLYSTQATLTEAEYADTALEARFNFSSCYTGFEEYASGATLSSGGTSSTTPVAYTSDGWHSGTSTWMSNKVSTTFANSGTKSLAIYQRNNNGLYYEFPVAANTAYYINFKWFINSIWDSTNNTKVRNFTIGTTAIADASDTSANALVKSGQILANNQWNDQTMVFNSGTNTTLRFLIDYYSDATDNANTYLYLDNLTIATAYKVTATQSGTGGHVTTPSVAVAPGQTATFTAVPNAGDTFLGWYLGETKVADTATYVTPAINADAQYVAKFTSNTVYTNGTFENYANNTRIDNYIAPEQTTAPAASWHGTSPWYQNMQRFPSSNYSWISATVTNAQAHSGTNSLVLSGMYQGFYTEITNILPNTTYTLSFYYKLPAWDETNIPSINHCSIIPGTSQVDYYGNPANYPTVSNQADRSYFSTYNAADTANDLWQQAIVYQGLSTKGTGNWELQSITFNSGSNASVFLSLGYSALATSGIKMYVDDITMAQATESLMNIDADTNSGRLTGGTGTAVTTEVATTASDPAVLGSKVYSITSTTDFTAAYTTDNMFLKKDKQYDVSFYFKVADGHKMLTTTDSTLQYVSFFVSASQNTTNIPIKSAYTLTKEPVGGTKVVGNSQTTEFNVFKTSVVDGGGNAIWQKLTASFTPTNDTMATIAIRPNAAGTVYIDQLKVTCAENATASVQAALSEVGTAIRTSGVQALRFKTSIDKSAIQNLYYDTYELVEYGSVAIRTSYLNGHELVDGSYTQADGTTIKNVGKGVAYIKGQKNIIFADTGDTIQFTGALTGIAQSNYNTSYSLRAYAVLKRPDGSTFTIYDDVTRTATIYAIANLAYNAPGGNNGYAEPPAVRDYLNTNIISKADFVTYPGDGFKHLS